MQPLLHSQSHESFRYYVLFPFSKWEGFSLAKCLHFTVYLKNQAASQIRSDKIPVLEHKHSRGGWSPCWLVPTRVNCSFWSTLAPTEIWSYWSILWVKPFWLWKKPEKVQWVSQPPMVWAEFHIHININPHSIVQSPSWCGFAHALHPPTLLTWAQWPCTTCTRQSYFSD